MSCLVEGFSVPPSRARTATGAAGAAAARRRRCARLLRCRMRSISSQPLSRAWRWRSPSVKEQRRAVGQAQFAARQVDLDRLATPRLRPAPARGGGQRHRQQAVVDAVGLEDLAEAGRHDAAQPRCHQRPRRLLAAGAAAEVGPGHQDLRAAPGIAVQHEVGPLAALRRRSGARGRRSGPGPVLLVITRKRAGKRMSVSASASGSGAPPTQRGEGSRHARLRTRGRGSARWPGQRAGRGSGRAHQMGVRTALAAPRSCGCWCWRSAAGPHAVAVHRHAQRAAGGAPLKPASSEPRSSPRPPPGPPRQPNPARRWPAHAGDAPTAHHRRGGAPVLDAAVGARADEHHVDGQVLQRWCRVPGPCGQAHAAVRRRAASSEHRRGEGTQASIGSPGRGWCPR